MEINKTKSKTKKSNNSLSNIGSSLRESLKDFTSIKNNSNNFEQETNELISNNDIKQSPITSMIKSPSFKPISQTPIESLKQVSEKIGETSSSFFNITSICIFLLIFFVLGFFGYIIYEYLTDENININNLIASISNFFSQFVNNKDSKENEKLDEKLDEKSDKKNNEKSDEKYNEKIIKDVENKKNVKTLETTVKNKKILKTENSKKLIANEENEEPEPIRTDSLSSGYCYIGKVNDTRYCTKVDARSKCMSGDIYPTMDICVNPNLRA
jgi:predicted PurR-regulated permease PerM